MSRSPQEQLVMFLKLLQDQKKPRTSPALPAVLDWIRNFPRELPDEDRIAVRTAICGCFDMLESELDHLLVENGNGKVVVATQGNYTAARERSWEIEHSLDRLLPTSGFLRRYVEYTRCSEAPLAYHVFCAALGIGAVVNRRVWFDMGIYKLFPAGGVIILGPSGIKKTSAANIIVNMLTNIELTKIYSEKLTPEALIESMRGDQAVGLIYAPEMAVFLSKAKYMEGFVQLITRFMDCPDKWESGTIMRGSHVLRNIAISSLMCSTPDWFISSVPEDSFSGGFIPRNVLVVQFSSPRVEPIPRPPDPAAREALEQELALMHTVEGEAVLSKSARSLYIEWYHGTKVDRSAITHDIMASYSERKPDHVKRLAIILHIAQHQGLEICIDCFERALHIIDWTEQFLPPLLDDLFKSDAGQDQALVLRKLRESHGRIAHYELVKRLQYKFTATQVRNIISSLKESNQVTEDKTNHLSRIYVLKEED